MTRLISLIVLLVLLSVASVLAGDLPQVLQPNTTAYSASEVAALTQAIATLTDALNDYSMASRRFFSDNEWSSRDFAMYTAGVLAEKGYETVLVSDDVWSDGTHTWVLVGISLGPRTAWIPVEAAPEQGQTQQILGSVPSTTDVTGKMWFEGRYIGFAEATKLPANMAPVAKIRPTALIVQPNQSLRFMAIASYDPDGEIVLYKWDFGDGKTEVSSSWSIRHKFLRSGSYVVVLSTVDNLGQSTTEDVTLRVVRRSEADSPAPPSGGCGCGG